MNPEEGTNGEELALVLRERGNRLYQSGQLGKGMESTPSHFYIGNLQLIVIL